MFANFDKQQLTKTFSKQADNYEKSATIQLYAAQKLCQIIQPFLFENCHILDLGSGTGFVAQNLTKNLSFIPSGTGVAPRLAEIPFSYVNGTYEKNFNIIESDISAEMLKRNRNSHSKKIQADFENLPFEDNSFDIITSSFSLQWSTNFEKNFSRFFSLLKTQGIFAFCLPCEESLNELKSANIFSFNQLPKKEELQNLLKKVGFKEMLCETENITQKFSNGIEAIKSLKKTGANYSFKNQNLLTKSHLKKFNSFCLKNFGDESRKISITWSVNYFIFQK